MNVEERFLKYVSFGTNSDEESEATPSSPEQWELGRFIADELKNIGLSDVVIDDKCYVYGKLPSNTSAATAPIGFIAHMDTSSAVPGDNIKPRIIHYEGGDIELGNGVWTRESVFPGLSRYVGHDLIITDGTTLLGGDDKAGVAEIVSAMEYLIEHPEIEHGDIYVGFTPDEEIGRGADFFDLERFAAEYAYTVDGGTLGGLEYENFNAAGVKIVVEGYSIHPGSAKDKMRNAVTIAGEFMNMMPPAEVPEHTEGYEGFYHIGGIGGDVCEVKMGMIIRDHDRAKFEARKEFVKGVADYLNKKYGAGTVEIEIKDSYYNMLEKVAPFMHIVERAEKAMLSAGVEPKTIPIRGGTDGARLSWEGLPCPNISTGCENCHGVNEFASIPDMRKMTEIIVNIAKAQ